MIFKEQDLNTTNLDNCIYLTEEESKINVNTVPVIENKRINSNVVDFSYVEKISEDYNVDYLTALSSIEESNGLDDATVMIDEYKIIEDPDIVNEINNIAIKPESEDSLAYRFCESALQWYLETGDEEYLDCIVDEEAHKSDIGSASNKEKGSGFLPATLDSVKMRFIPPKVDLGTLGTKKDNGIFKGLPIVGGGSKSSSTSSSSSKSNSSTGSSVLHTIADKVGKPFKSDSNSSPSSSNNSSSNSSPKSTSSSSSSSSVGSAASSVASSIGNAITGNSSNGNGGHTLRNVAIGTGAAAGIAGSVAIVRNLIKQSENKPKSWIARKIASLRHIYSRWLEAAKKQSDAGKANIIKSAAAKVLQVIDALLAKMQKLSDRH